jgi:hypothetical protein
VKAFRVILDGGCEEEIVAADEWMELDESIVFYANGQPIPDVSFQKSSVTGINVVSDNAENLNR